MFEEKSRIEEYIELQVRSNDRKKGHFFSDKYKRSFNTEAIEDGLLSQETLPIQKVFKPSLVNKIGETILFGIVFFGTGLLIGVLGQQWHIAAFFISIGLGSFVRIWLNSPKNIITLNKTGILYNKSFYPWKDIVSTYILYFEGKTKEAEIEKYLLVELTNGKIKKLDLIGLFLSTITEENPEIPLRTLAHYVESYKRLAKTK